jgi:8-oxo-dGTP pyrophosphatase MutT (NUDIX family)
MPAGAIESSDRTIVESLERECLEELGVKAQRIGDRALGIAVECDPTGRTTIDFVVALQIQCSGAVLLSAEHSEFIEVRRADLPAALKTLELTRAAVSSLSHLARTGWPE